MPVHGAAASAGPTCAGKAATIVSNAGRIVGSRGNDVIAAGSGANDIAGMGGNDTICGGGGGDTISGGRGSDHLYGGGGDDKLDGGRGCDTAVGGGGDDTTVGGRGSDHLDGGAETDRMFGGTGNDWMTGGSGNADYVDEGPGDGRLVSGGAGDYDVVVGGPGTDPVSGGPGTHDIASYANTVSPIAVNLADGSVTGSESERLDGVEDVIGGSGNDALTGSSALNRLDGGPGDDTLRAVGPGDDAFGGPGSNSCVGGFASEDGCGQTAVGGGTTVRLVESIDGSSTLVITGTDRADQITVTQTADGYRVSAGLGQLIGGACQAVAATVSCGGSASRILASMGPGNDTLDLTGVTVGAVADGGPGGDAILGGDGNDILYGGDDHDPDALSGGGGDDLLYGVNVLHPRKDSGAAEMAGGAGDDLMVGGQPCDGDVFDGGPGGNDSASFARVRNTGVFVSAATGGSVTDPEVGNCRAGSITRSTEKIEGSPGADILTGDGGPNVLLGRGGNDTMDGRSGVDRCIGGSGSDGASGCEQIGSIP